MIASFLANTFDFSGSAQKLDRLKQRVYGPPLLFFHVPKCGGTSLSHAFRLKYLASSCRISEEISSSVVSPQAIDRWMEYKRDLFLYQVLSGTHFVQGHVPYSSELFDPLRGRAVFMTVLRRPVDRVISHFFFDTRLTHLSFQEFLDTQRGVRECSVYSRFFGGLSFASWDSPTENRDRAIEVLKRFDLVGILEEPRKLEQLLRAKAQLRMRLPVRNVGVQRHKDKREITQSDLERVTEMCRHDREIYAAFQSRAESNA